MTTVSSSSPSDIAAEPSSDKSPISKIHQPRSLDGSIAASPPVTVAANTKMMGFLTTIVGNVFKDYSTSCEPVISSSFDEGNDEITTIDRCRTR